MLLTSTRDTNVAISPLDAVLSGISAEGGLFVPTDFPQISIEEVAEFANSSYERICSAILGRFFDLDTDEIAKKACSSFTDSEVTPLKKVGDLYVLELFHGPTLAFKDLALQVLPQLMSNALKENSKVLILTATSGDTGKAALCGFANVRCRGKIKIAVFYPDGGVSDFQKLQMVSQQGENVEVIAVKGNFDDAQTGEKNLFADTDFGKTVRDAGFSLSSANSINIGRLVPQIAYYFFAYSRLIKDGAITAGDAVDFTVPTGNFGNILAAYYAKRMGLPIEKLICASNANNVLTDFLTTGVYCSSRDFHLTMSPSMDILISSNLERLIFELYGQNSEKVVELMHDLKTKKRFEVGETIREKLTELFCAGFLDDTETKAVIAEVFTKTGYVLDPHSAVAYGVGELNKSDRVNVVISTASPYKFAADVLCALGKMPTGNVFADCEMLSEISKTPVPKAVSELKNATVLHDTVCEISEMKAALLPFVR